MSDVRVKQQPSSEISGVEFNVHSSYYSDFFLLRTPITINGRPAVIKTVNGEPVLRVCGISVKLSAIMQQAVAPVAKKHGVYSVGTFYYEQVALFLINFPSKSSLKKFLTKKEAVQKKLSSAISDLFEEDREVKSVTQPQPLLQSSRPQQFQVAVDMKVYLVSPAVGRPPVVNEINLANHSFMAETWKRSKLFDFTNTMFTKPPAATNIGDLTLLTATQGSIPEVANRHTQSSNSQNQDTNKQTGSSPNIKRGVERAGLADLQVELKGVIAWFDLGIQLKIPTHDLLAIREDHRTVEKCRLEMLIRWEQLEKPTWTKLFSALVNIGMKGLADSLAEKYGLPQPFRVMVTPAKGSASSKFVESEEKLTVKMKELKQAKELQTVTSQKLEEEISEEVPLLQHKVKSLTTETEFLQMQLKQRNKEMVMFKKMKLSAEQDELQLIDSLLKEKNKQIRSLQKELTQKETELDATKKQLKEKKTELTEMMKELSAKSDQVFVLETEVEKLKQSFDEQQDEMNRKLIEQSAASVSQEKYLKEVEIQRDVAEQEASKKEEEIQSYSQELTDKEEQISRLSEKISEQEREMAKLREKLESHHRTSEQLSAEQMREDDEREQQLLTLMMSAMKLQLELRQTKDKKNHNKMNLEATKKTVEKYKSRLELSNQISDVNGHGSVLEVVSQDKMVNLEQDTSPLTPSGSPPRTIYKKQETMGNVVALYSFTGRYDDELSFKEGDILQVTEKKSSDWWYVMDSDGRQGLIPVKYVKIQEPSSPNRDLTLQTCSDTSPIPSHQNQEPLSIVVSLYSFNGRDDQELSFKDGDILQVTEKTSPYWWYAVHSDGRHGYIPVNFVQIQESSSPSGDLTLQSVKKTVQIPLSEPKFPLELNWRRVTNAPFGIWGCPSAVVMNAYVYIGGVVAYSTEDKLTVCIYHPDSDSWFCLPPYQYTFFRLAVINEPRNQLVAVGGLDEETGRVTNKLAVWEHYWQLLLLPAMNTACHSPAVATYNEWLLVAGGFGELGQCLSRVEVMNTIGKVWYQVSTSIPVACAGMSSTIVGNTWYLIGGFTDKGASRSVMSVCIEHIISEAISQPAGANSSTLLRWNSLPDIPLIRSTALAFQGTLVAIGGLGAGYSSAIYFYKPSTSMWIKVGENTIPTGRLMPACTVLPNGCMIMIAGGDGGKDCVDIVQIIPVTM